MACVCSLRCREKRETSKDKKTLTFSPVATSLFPISCIHENTVIYLQLVCPLFLCFFVPAVHLEILIQDGNRHMCNLLPSDRKHPCGGLCTPDSLYICGLYSTWNIYTLLAHQTPNTAPFCSMRNTTGTAGILGLFVVFARQDSVDRKEKMGWERGMDYEQPGFELGFPTILSRKSRDFF